MRNKEKTFVSAVIYMHNSDIQGECFVREIAAFLTEHFENSEIICVNDYSTDNTVQLLRSSAEKIHSTTVTLVNLSYYHGIEMAMNAGDDFAIGDHVFEFDTVNRDYDFSLVFEAYQKAQEGFDIVSASPEKRQRLSSKIFYRVINHHSGSTNILGTEAFRLLSRRVINRIKSMSKATPYRKIAYAESGMKSSVISYVPTQSELPQTTKEEKKYRFALAVDTLIMFTDIGYKCAVAMTAVMILIVLAMIIYSVAVYAMGIAIEGWTTTILFLSIAFFGLFAVLTVIIKYLQLIIDLVFKRKHYTFESIEKLTK